MTIFDRWLAAGRPVPVRMFDSIISTTHGSGSLTESLGLDPSDLVVVETDGTFEQADSLKTAFDRAPATGLDVFRHTLDQVARHPGIVARQSGLDGLCETCQTCPVVSSCGGGLYAHRYRTGSGFDNPSVYCTDLLELITHVRRRVERPVHQIPAAELDTLARGYGGAEAVGHLAAAQRSLRRALLAALRCEGAAWELLTEAGERDADALDTVLAHPYVRVWAAAGLRGSVDEEYLAGMAVAAAVRAGLTARLVVPGRSGALQLPTLGRLEFASSASETVEIADGVAEVAGRTAWHPLRRLTAPGVSVAIEDSDPYRDCHQWPVVGRLDDERLSAWQRTFQAAWEYLERDFPNYAPALAAGLSTITPLTGAEPGRQVSSTARQAFGAVALALPDDAASFCLLLIHEFQHVKLGAVLDMLDLLDPTDQQLYYAPWRDDPRPLEGLLQGTYAHLAVTEYWRSRCTTGIDAEVSYARWRAMTAEAVDALDDSGSLTALGRRFVTGMRCTLLPWLNEPVSAAAASRAAAGARSHRAAWDTTP
jgi:uncharacterized protein